jgi:hypothetical protein
MNGERAHRAPAIVAEVLLGRLVTKIVVEAENGQAWAASVIAGRRRSSRAQRPVTIC